MTWNHTTLRVLLFLLPLVLTAAIEILVFEDTFSSAEQRRDNPIRAWILGAVMPFVKLVAYTPILLGVPASAILLVATVVAWGWFTLFR